MLLTHSLALTIWEDLCRAVNSEYSRRALEAGPLCRHEMPIPTEYVTPGAFQADYLIYNYLRKYCKGVLDEKTLADECLASFLQVEAKNKMTNWKFRHSKWNPDVNSVFDAARKIIRSVLGPFRWSDCLAYCDWGPGGTSTIRRREANPATKTNERHLSVSKGCLGYARAWLENDPMWMTSRLSSGNRFLGPDGKNLEVEGPFAPLSTEFMVVNSSVFDTVDKDAFSRRTIDKQPTLNSFFQKGPGGRMRARLKRIGIDLSDQGVNQGLALRAYANGYATEDLRNASNTVTLGAVRFFLALCPDWLDVLERLRCPSTVLPDGTVHELDLFSSMGNGFTFELETLIFYALAKAVAGESGIESPVVSVYGDDIIVDAAISVRLRYVLSEAGFEVNSSKSFNSGPFYESCGDHYWGGVMVTPVFQKEEIVDLPSAVRAFNRLYRWTNRCADPGLSLRVLKAAVRLPQTKWPSYLGLETRVVQPLWWKGDNGFYCDDSVFTPDPHGTVRFFALKGVVEQEVKSNRALLWNTLRRASFRVRPFDDRKVQSLASVLDFGRASKGMVDINDDDDCGKSYLLNEFKTCWESAEPTLLSYVHSDSPFMREEPVEQPTSPCGMEWEIVPFIGGDPFERAVSEHLMWIHSTITR